MVDLPYLVLRLLANEKNPVVVEEAITLIPSTIEKQELLPRWSQTEQTTAKLSAKDRFINLQCILLNTFTTVAIVFMNKM